VLVLHNRPGSIRFAESDAGVLNQVRHVEDALARLGVRRRTQGVLTLREAAGAVAGGTEEVVFNLVEILEGPAPDYCHVPALCRALGRGVTGGDTACQIRTLDKWVAKALLRAYGVPVPAAAVVPLGAAPEETALPAGDLIVKPVAADASEGIDGASVVRGGDRQALSAAVAKIHRDFAQPALAEQFIEGREFNLSLFEDEEGIRPLPPAEIEFDGLPPGRPRIVDYAAKWLEGSEEYRGTVRRVPAAVSAAQAADLRRCALAAWRATGCLDYTRVDMRCDAAGRPYVLEVNSNPDLSPVAGFPAALSAAGIPFERFVGKMIENAAARRQREIGGA
jgi:D-alanine-D-alanine ligase